MGKLKVQYLDDRMQFTNLLGKYERVNNEELKVLQNHCISRLLPAALYSRWGKLYMEVKVRGVIPLISYYSILTAQTALSFVWETLHTAMECERMGLRPEKLCWNPEHIFVDPTRGAVYMVYWPVVKLQCSDQEMVGFFSGLIPWLESGGLPANVVNNYRAYFHQRQHLDMPQFYQIVRGMFDQLQHCADISRDEAAKKKRVDDDRRFHQEAQPVTAYLEKGVDRFHLVGTKVFIGRDKTVCEVVPENDPGMSRKHAAIQNYANQYYITDLNSRNGVLVRGQRIPPGQPVLLKSGDTVSISRTTFVFRSEKANHTVLIHHL